MLIFVIQGRPGNPGLPGQPGNEGPQVSSTTTANYPGPHLEQFHHHCQLPRPVPGPGGGGDDFNGLLLKLIHNGDNVLCVSPYSTDQGYQWIL